MLSAKEKRKIEERFSLCKYLFGKMGYYPPKVGCVYAFDMSDDTVKIGVTTDINKRIKGVQSVVYLKVRRIHQTNFAPLNFMRIIERRCHDTFVDRHVRGEYFDITFEEACVELDRYADEITSTLKAADAKFLEEFAYWEELKEKYADASKVTSPAAKEKNAIKSERPQLNLARVYVLLMSNNTVKIGISGKLRPRVAKIKRDNNLTVKDIYFSPLMSREDARLIEWACQEKFSSRRVQGEFFSASFEEACEAIDTFVESLRLLPNASKKFFISTNQIVDKRID